MRILRVAARARAIQLLLVLATLGCGGSGGSIADLHLPTIAGTWTLKTVNGAAPPGVVQVGDPKIELLSDTYTFTTNGAYSETGQLRTTTGASVVTEAVVETGAWILGPTSIALYPTDSAPYTATVGTNSLTFTFGTLILVYTQ